MNHVQSYNTVQSAVNTFAKSNSACILFKLNERTNSQEKIKINHSF